MTRPRSTSNNRITRRDALRQMTAGMVATTALPARDAIEAAIQTPADGTPSARFFPGFKPLTIQTSGATINAVMAGQGPPVLLLHGAPQSMHLVAPGGARSRQGPHGRRHRSPRLRRQQQAARRREPRELLEAGDGARSGRSDAAARLRAVRRHRPRSRRTRRPPHGARSPGSRHQAGGARHRADVLPLHARHDRVRPGVLPLVQLRAARRRRRRIS